MSLKPTQSFLKVIGLLSIFTLAPISIYLLYHFSGGPTSGRELELQKNLRFALMAGTDTVDLAPLTEWSWVKVCAFTSNVSPDDVNKVVGFPYKDYDDLYWMPHAEYWTLLFIDETHRANWGPVTPVVPVRIPRASVADLSLPDGVKGACTDKAEGGLVASRRTDAPVGVSPVTIRIGKRTP